MEEIINFVSNFNVDKVILNCGEYNYLEKELIEVLDININNKLSLLDGYKLVCYT